MISASCGLADKQDAGRDPAGGQVLTAAGAMPLSLAPSALLLSSASALHIDPYRQPCSSLPSLSPASQDPPRPARHCKCDRSLTRLPTHGTGPHSLPKLALKPWITPRPKGFKLINARVVDPAGSSLLDGLQQVVVIDGRFVAVQPVGTELSSELGDVSSLREIDVEGNFICP